MCIIDSLFKFLPLSKTIHLLQKQRVFDNQLVHFRICFAQIFEIKAFIGIHFTPDVSLYSIYYFYIIHHCPFL